MVHVALGAADAVAQGLLGDSEVLSDASEVMHTQDTSTACNYVNSTAFCHFDAVLLASLFMSEEIRRTLTEEHREESRRLKAIWAERKERISQAEFGQTYDIGSQAAVGHFLNGKAAISLKAARGFAKGLGCEIADFSPRLAGEAAALGEVAGGNNQPLNFTQLSKDEMQLIMVYRSVPKLIQARLLADAEARLRLHQAEEERHAPAAGSPVAVHRRVTAHAE